MEKINFKIWFWLAVGLQILVLFVVLIYNQYQFMAGERVVLKLVRPRDPLSLFQGHYLRLNYEISQLNKSDLTAPGDFDRLRWGDIVYVTLKEGKESWWQPYQVSQEKPEGEITIKGKVLSRSGNRMSVEYGIESYFIPEKNWQEIEEIFRGLEIKEELFVEVSISKSGYALIRKLLVDGEEIDIAKIGEYKERPEPSLNERARDARVMSAVAQARTVMTIINAQEGNYDNFACQNSEMKPLCDDILNGGSEAIIAHNTLSSSTGACIYAQLNAGNWYCADYKGYAGVTWIFPGEEGYCIDGESAECPPVESP